MNEVIISPLHTHSFFLHLSSFSLSFCNKERFKANIYIYIHIYIQIIYIAASSVVCERVSPGFFCIYARFMKTYRRFNAIVSQLKMHYFSEGALESLIASQLLKKEKYI